METCHRGTGSTATRQYSVQSKVAFGLTRVSRAGPAVAGSCLPLPGSLSFEWNRGCFFLCCCRGVLDRPHQRDARQARAPTVSEISVFMHTQKNRGSGFTFSNPGSAKFKEPAMGRGQKLVLHRAARGEKRTFLLLCLTEM